MILVFKKITLLSIYLIFIPTFLSSQNSLYIDNDTLKSSLNVIIHKIDSDEIYKKNNYIFSDNYNYFNSINSIEFSNEIIDIISKINAPFTQDQLLELSFVECYNWTESNYTWFITLTDKLDNSYVYFFEIGMKRPVMYGVVKGGDCFYRLADNLYRNFRCGEKNEDYIVWGKIVNNKFISYYSSQLYHSMDFVLFSDLLKIISNYNHNK